VDSCSCLYGGFDEFDENGFQCRTVRTARKEHKCVECHQTIEKGQKYSHFSSKNDGRIWTSRTCLSCEDIREALYCDGYYFGRMWHDITEQIFKERGLTVACIDKLQTPEAKAFIQKRWMDYLMVQ
jgi:hypothetical protein